MPPKPLLLNLAGIAEMYNDSRQRFIFEDAPVRGEIVRLNATWQAVLERHPYPRQLQTLLGELMAATALLSATIKFNGSLIVQLQGEGPLHLVVVECTSDNTMRATAKWQGELISGSFTELLGGKGRFVITIVPEEGKQNYQGTVELSGNSIAEVLEHYMMRSEQLDTRFWLIADSQHAVGLLLQKLPSATLEDTDDWERIRLLTATVEPHELLNVPTETLLHRLYSQEDVRLFEARPISFRCSCSRERVVAMLRMLGHAEVKTILQERDKVEVHCEFCNRNYQFDSVDAEQVFAAEVITSVPETRH